jgi:hypothetical protein
LTRAIRRLIGLVAVVSILLLLAIAPVAVLLGLGFGGGDAFQRMILGGCVLLLGLLAAAVIGFSDASAGSILRSPLSWCFVAVLVAAILWGAFGIDSVRPVRSLAEAEVAYPRAIELGRSESPAAGGFDGRTGASFTRRYATSDSIEQVAAYFGDQLVPRGWQGPTGVGSVVGQRLIEWRRDDFTIQIQVLAPPRTGEFWVTIWGPSR